MPVSDDPPEPVSDDAPDAVGGTASDGPPADQAGLPVNELFESLQGEGKLAGVPSVFVRTSGCNLRCWFYDSYHTSWDPTHAVFSVADLLAEIREYDADHVVVTGGEPLIHDETATLLEELADDGYHTTVETNGTVDVDAPIDLASISPKLASSTPTAERADDPATEAGNPSSARPDGKPVDAEWASRHDERRLDVETLARLTERYDFQLKFVVTGREDVAEIEDLLGRIRAASGATIDDTDVLLMPEGQTRDRLSQTRTVVAELARETGYRYTPRLHVDLWNDAPET